MNSSSPQRGKPRETARYVKYLVPTDDDIGAIVATPGSSGPASSSALVGQQQQHLSTPTVPLPGDASHHSHPLSLTSPNSLGGAATHGTSSSLAPTSALGTGTNSALPTPTHFGGGGALNQQQQQLGLAAAASNPLHHTPTSTNSIGAAAGGSATPISLVSPLAQHPPSTLQPPPSSSATTRHLPPVQHASASVPNKALVVASTGAAVGMGSGGGGVSAGPSSSLGGAANQLTSNSSNVGGAPSGGAAAGATNTANNSSNGGATRLAATSSLKEQQQKVKQYIQHQQQLQMQQQYHQMLLQHQQQQLHANSGASSAYTYSTLPISPVTLMPTLPLAAGLAAVSTSLQQQQQLASVNGNPNPTTTAVGTTTATPAVVPATAFPMGSTLPPLDGVSNNGGFLPPFASISGGMLNASANSADGSIGIVASPVTATTPGAASSSAASMTMAMGVSGAPPCGPFGVTVPGTNPSSKDLLAASSNSGGGSADRGVAVVGAVDSVVAPTTAPPVTTVGNETPAAQVFQLHSPPAAADDDHQGVGEGASAPNPPQFAVSPTYLNFQSFPPLPYGESNSTNTNAVCGGGGGGVYFGEGGSFAGMPTGGAPPAMMGTPLTPAGLPYPSEASSSRHPSVTHPHHHHHHHQQQAPPPAGAVVSRKAFKPTAAAAYQKVREIDHNSSAQRNKLETRMLLGGGGGGLPSSASRHGTPVYPTLTGSNTNATSDDLPITLFDGGIGADPYPNDGGRRSTTRTSTKRRMAQLHSSISSNPQQHSEHNSWANTNTTNFVGPYVVEASFAGDHSTANGTHGEQHSSPNSPAVPSVGLSMQAGAITSSGTATGAGGGGHTFGGDDTSASQSVHAVPPSGGMLPTKRSFKRTSAGGGHSASSAAAPSQVVLTRKLSIGTDGSVFIGETQYGASEGATLGTQPVPLCSPLTPHCTNSRAASTTHHSASALRRTSVTTTTPPMGAIPMHATTTAGGAPTTLLPSQSPQRGYYASNAAKQQKQRSNPNTAAMANSSGGGVGGAGYKEVRHRGAKYRKILNAALSAAADETEAKARRRLKRLERLYGPHYAAILAEANGGVPIPFSSGAYGASSGTLLFRDQTDPIRKEQSRRYAERIAARNMFSPMFTTSHGTTFNLPPVSRSQLPSVLGGAGAVRHKGTQYFSTHLPPPRLVTHSALPVAPKGAIYKASGVRTNGTAATTGGPLPHIPEGLSGISAVPMYQPVVGEGSALLPDAASAQAPGGWGVYGAGHRLESPFPEGFGLQPQYGDPTSATAIANGHYSATGSFAGGGYGTIANNDFTLDGYGSIGGGGYKAISYPNGGEDDEEEDEEDDDEYEVISYTDSAADLMVFVVPAAVNYALNTLLAVIPLGYIGNRLGQHALSTTASGYFFVCIVAIYPLHGLLFAIDTLCSHAYGIDNSSNVMGLILQRGLALCLVGLGLIQALLSLGADPFLRLIYKKEVAKDISEFVWYSPLYVVCTITVAAFSRFLSSQMAPSIPMLATIVGLVVTVAWQSHLAERGTRWVALGMGVATLCQLITILCFTLKRPQIRKTLGPLRLREALQLSDVKSFLTIAIPSSVFIAVEAAAYDVTILMATAISDGVGSAWAALMSYEYLLTFAAAGLSAAACAKVGAAIGANQPINAKTYAWTAIGMAVGWGIIAVIPVFTTFYKELMGAMGGNQTEARRVYVLYPLLLLLDLVESTCQGIFSGANAHQLGAPLFAAAMWGFGVPLAAILSSGLVIRIANKWNGHGFVTRVMPSKRAVEYYGGGGGSNNGGDKTKGGYRHVRAFSPASDDEAEEANEHMDSSPRGMSAQSVKEEKKRTKHNAAVVVVSPPAKAGGQSQQQPQQQLPLYTYPPHVITEYINHNTHTPLVAMFEPFVGITGLGVGFTLGLTVLCALLLRALVRMDWVGIAFRSQLQEDDEDEEEEEDEEDEDDEEDEEEESEEEGEEGPSSGNVAIDDLPPLDHRTSYTSSRAVVSYPQYTPHHYTTTAPSIDEDVQAEMEMVERRYLQQHGYESFGLGTAAGSGGV